MQIKSLNRLQIQPSVAALRGQLILGQHVLTGCKFSRLWAVLFWLLPLFFCVLTGCKFSRLWAADIGVAVTEATS